MLTDRSIEAARALQLQGRTAAAEALYRELLQNQPEYVGALEALGVLVFQQGRAQEALHLFARGDDSAGVSPDAGEPGEALRVVGRHHEALDHLRKAVAVDPALALLWPGARVVLCGRDPRDIAVSCWQAGFQTNPWSNVWEHIAQRFADHQRIVEHWKTTRPLEWLDVGYEELVADLEWQARRLIDFVGLEWEPTCLEFHLTKRVVRTLSLVQVRQPIHSHSVGRWKNYEPSLQPLFSAFDAMGFK